MSDQSLSREISNKTDNLLFKKIKRLATVKEETPKKDEDRLSLFYRIWCESKPALEEEYLRSCLSELIGASGPKEMTRFFGRLCRSCIPSLLGLGIQKERHAPHFNRVVIRPGGLLLPPFYYLNTHAKKSMTWLSYVQYISTCALELGLPFLMKAIQGELELAAFFIDEKKDVNITHSGKSLKTWVPEFEWDGFMEGLQLDSQWESRIWILNNPDQLKRILRWMCRADKEVLVGLWSLHLIRSSSYLLRKSIQDAYHSLFVRALTGMKNPISRNKQFITLVENVLPGPLCSLYSKAQDLRILKEVDHLANELRESAITIMKDVKKMSKKAQSSILEKLRRMKFKLGKGPSNPSPLVRYDTRSLFHTVLTILSESTLHMVKNTCRPSSSEDGQYPCFIFNASYHPEINQCVIPWGILQEPYYSREAPLGFNYGGLGATISHEITHAFDLQGSLYSERAIYKNSWTRRNRIHFKKQTRKVSRFFSGFKHYGIHLNGKKTVSEDWADLGGMKIALHALGRELDKRKLDEKERREAYRNFFIGYATSWRKVIRKEMFILLIHTDVHSPAEDRVDRIVPQFQEWVDAFDVKESDKLYIPERNRLKFF